MDQLYKFNSLLSKKELITKVTALLYNNYFAQFAAFSSLSMKF